MIQLVKLVPLKVIAVKLSSDENIDRDLFLLRERSKQEKADYDIGFAAGLSGRDFDDDRSSAWQRGWAEAQE